MYPRLTEFIRARFPEAVAIYLFGSSAGLFGSSAGLFGSLAGLFGSLARPADEQRADSDIDLAVLLPSRIPELERWALQEQLAVIAGRNVDLIDLRAASAVMKVQVLDGGVLLYEGVRAEREAFEALALSDYARLNEERRGILDDVRRLGSIHG